MAVSKSRQGPLAGIVGGFPPLDAALYVPAAYLPHGTSFPAQPAFGNDRSFRRDDLDLDFFYDGTRWLSQLFAEPFTPEAALSGAISASGSYGRWQDWNAGAYDVWVDSVQLIMYAASLTGSAYWSIQIVKGTAAESESNVGSSVNSSADTSVNWTNHNVTVGALLGSTYRYLRASMTKTSTPGSLYWRGRVLYRLVGT